MVAYQQRIHAAQHDSWILISVAFTSACVVYTPAQVFEEGWLKGMPFYGGYGLLTVNGVAKPAYRAFEMLNTAGDQRVPVKITGQEWSYVPHQ